MLVSLEFRVSNHIKFTVFCTKKEIGLVDNGNVKEVSLRSD